MQRKIAFKIIYKTINESSYTNLLMRSELERVESIKRPFITNLVNGVLKNYDYLKFQHKDYYEKINLKNSVILSMALYEKFFLNEKEYVVNNEYVDLGESEYDKKFINAILRKIDKLKEPEDEFVKYSIPEWLYKLLSKQYSKEELTTILNNYHRIPKVYYHLNSKKASQKDISCLNVEWVDNKIFTSKNNLISTKQFDDGMFYVQDFNASTLIEEFPFNKDDLFLDACSAPGSKLFNALDYIESKNAYANDLNEKRVNLIKEHSIKLGYDDINFSNFDATKLHECFNFKFDKILLDVPCSGLGVIGRRNDIKFHIKPESLDELQNIQKDILSSASRIVKDNGYILYSTCTLNKKENDKQIDNFLLEHTDFKLIRKKTIINLDGDMFFLALLKKV